MCEKNIGAQLLNMSILKILETINPYIPIAFLLMCGYILCKLCISYYTCIRYNEHIKCLFKHIISEEYYKYCAITLLKYKFMIMLVGLEVLINLIGSVGWNIDNTQSHDLPKSFNMSENCRIFDNKSLIALGSWGGWLLSLMTRVVEIVSCCLLPTICSALDVMRCKYLSHPYKERTKNWILYIMVSSGVLLLLCNLQRTYLIFYVLQTLLHWVNLIIYVITSKKLYAFICQTQKEVHSQTYNPETRTTSIRTKQELDRCTRNKREFLLTTTYTFILFFVLILQVTINAVILVVSTFVMNNCYFVEITFGYFPGFNFDSATLQAISKFREQAYIFTFSLSFLHQFLMFIAYFAVILSLSQIYRCCTRKKNKKLQENIKSMIQETYKNRN